MRQFKIERLHGNRPKCGEKGPAGGGPNLCRRKNITTRIRLLLGQRRKMLSDVPEKLLADWSALTIRRCTDVNSTNPSSLPEQGRTSTVLGRRAPDGLMLGDHAPVCCEEPASSFIENEE